MLGRSSGMVRRGVKIFVVLLAVLLVVGIIFASGFLVGNYKNVGNLLEVYSIIQSEYLRDVDTSELVQGAANGMVESLDDPYSAYLDKETYSHLQEQIRGTFGGLGILVGISGDYLTVVKTFEDTPAAKEGVQAGDKIISINGKDATGMDLETAVGIMRGPVGTEITITVLRKDREDPLEITLTREEISVPTVEGRVIDGTKIGHLGITQFNSNTPGETREALEKLQNKGIKGLILDLRNNPGGELYAAKKVADEFVPRGPVVHVDYKNGQDQTLKADSEYLDIPLVVLVNEHSASASEIVAGAVKDTGAGKLVGTTTFGKGVVQTIFPLDGGAALKLTTARYLTPDKNDINKKGIVPHVKVKQDEETSADEQLQKAVEALEKMFSTGKASKEAS